MNENAAYSPGGLPPELSNAVNAEAASGERITWTGQPIAYRQALGGIVVMLFGIPFAGFAVFWMSMAFFGTRSASHASGPGGVFSWAFPLFGLPFVLVGLGLVSAPLWMYLAARRTAYVITDRRAIIVSRGLFGRLSVRSFLPQNLTVIRRTQRADGSGNLILGQDWRTGGSNGPRSTDAGFMAVPDVRDVEARVSALIRPAGERLN